MLDFVAIVALAVAVLATAFRGRVGARVHRWARLIALVACVVQVVIAGPRLELMPAYVVAVLLAVFALVDVATNGFAATAPDTPPLRSRIVTLARWLAVGGATLLLLIALLLRGTLAGLDFPTPSGPHAIGVVELRLTDRARPDPFAESGAAREIVVRVSYPAENDGAFERLRQDRIPGIAALIVGAFLPNPVTASWGALPTHAKRDATLATAQQRYPVLIFSHGMGSYPEQNTALVEHLVSHGYVVMAVNHSYLSSYFRFADGSMIGLEFLFRPNPFPDDAQQSLDEDALGAKLADPGISTTERAALIRQRAAINQRSTDRWADIHGVMSADQRFVLDSLSAWPADSSLAGRLDLDRVGVFGMSSGGTATHMTCAVDRRCGAGLNMDGFQPLLIDLPPLRTPFMHMSRAPGLTNEIAHEQSQALSYIVRVAGAEHLSFTDDVLTLYRLKHFGGLGDDLLGTIDADRMVQIVNDYVLAFFNESLLGQHQPLLDGSTQRYPEAGLVSKR
jgi:predicted dienelactone hydrolase